MAKEKKTFRHASSQEETELPRPLCLHEDHRRPTTRREFLASGLISFSGMVMAPSFLSLLAASQRAQGASLDCGTRLPLPPFITVNLAGGAALCTNYIPLDKGGQPLSKYDTMSLGNPSSPDFTIRREFGGVGFAGGPSDSQLMAKILQGILETTSQSTRDKTSFIGVCVPSQDDSGLNKFDISGLVTKAGLVGDYFPNLGRLGNRPTGINQTFAQVPPPAPLIVKSVDDLKSALRAEGPISSQANLPHRPGLMKLIHDLSSLQAKKYAATGAPGLSNLVQCSTSKNLKLASGELPDIDPRDNATIATQWRIRSDDANTFFGQNKAVRTSISAMVYNALKGNAGAVGLDIGGYDYHNQTRAAVDTKDLDAGLMIGCILQSAAILNSKVYIQVCSDGGVGSPKGSPRGEPPSGDRGIAGMNFIIAYDPSRRPPVSGTQIGWFNEGQAASNDSVVGLPEKAAMAVFANYMRFAGQFELFERVLPGVFTTQDLDEILKFA